MNSLASNVIAADLMTRQLISDRVADAESRARARAVRTARRTAAARRTTSRARRVPAWRFGFLFPVH